MRSILLTGLGIAIIIYAIALAGYTTGFDNSKTTPKEILTFTR